MDYRARFRTYVRNVSSGKKICCLWETLAVQRYLDDLTELKEYTFDINEGNRYCKFFNLLQHYKGSKAGETFELQGWQCFIVMNIFGWKHKKSGVRRFNYADVFVPRKNGKSTFAAGIALAMMMIDGEMGAEIYSAAVDREQAKLVWETAKVMVEQSPAIHQFVETYKASIIMPSTVSTFKPLSKDTKNKDGLNPLAAICDERHAWKNNEMIDVITTGMGARKQPLIFSITTAGTDTTLPYFKQVTLLQDILLGKIKQENQFVMLFAPDEDDDWKDERTWYKVNPNLGVSLELDYLRKECEDAVRKGGTKEANFKTKNLNIWVDSPDIWIKDDFVKACDFHTDIDSLKGQKCYAGLDIASHVDLNALALYFPEVEHKPVLMHFWAPETKIFDPDMADRVDYASWARQGWIHPMEGNVLDVDQMSSDILGICHQYNLQNLAFDPYKAYHGIIQNLQKAGMGEYLDEYGQSILNMSEPTKELEKMVVNQEIDLMGNPIMRWMFGNVVIYMDANENIKVHKGKSRNKIDGIAALVNAIGGYMSKKAAAQGNMIYTTHSLRTLRL